MARNLGKSPRIILCMFKNNFMPLLLVVLLDNKFGLIVLSRDHLIFFQLVFINKGYSFVISTFYDIVGCM